MSRRVVVCPTPPLPSASMPLHYAFAANCHRIMTHSISLHPVSLTSQMHRRQYTVHSTTRSDFMHYRNGTYARTPSAHGPIGGHAIKLVGWGTDSLGTPYWYIMYYGS